MDEKEALEIIEIAKAEVEWNYPLEYDIAFNIAVTALEKQIAKKPICKEDAYTGLVTSYRCPVCSRFFGQAGKRNVILFNKEPYCQGKDCGQKIDWESVEKDREGA